MSVPSSLARFQPRVVADADGKMAESLGAETSGHVFVYDAANQLVFSGGVTPGRAHRGRTEGQQVLREFLAHGVAGPAVGAKAPVFGCEIQDHPTATAR